MQIFQVKQEIQQQQKYAETMEAILVQCCFLWGNLSTPEKQYISIQKHYPYLVIVNFLRGNIHK